MCFASKSIQSFVYLVVWCSEGKIATPTYPYDTTNAVQVWSYQFPVRSVSEHLQAWFTDGIDFFKCNPPCSQALLDF
jgi:hypothetical protein